MQNEIGMNSADISLNNGRNNGNGMPGGAGDWPFGERPIVIDGGYKSNNRNLNVQPTSTVFDATDEGIGMENKINYVASEPRPFSKA